MLELTAADRIDVVGSGSGIVVTDGSGALGGNLLLATDGVFAAEAGTRLAAGTIAIEAGATLTTGQVDVGQSLQLTSGADLVLDDAITAPAIAFTSGANLIANGTLTAPTVALTAGADLTVAAINASTSVNLAAGGNAVIRGVVAAPTITLAAADLDIQSTGQLGTGAGALAIAVTANGLQTVIGGTEEGPGFTLTQAEADRIEARQVSLTAPATGTDAGRAPDVLVRDIVVGSEEGDAPFVLSLATPGRLRIAGNVQFRNAAAEASLTLAGQERLEVITPGSVRIRNAAGAPSGNLILSGGTVTVATQALADQLAANPNFEGRNAALATNTGPVNEGGYIEGGRVSFLIGSNAFVQNTGTATNFAGVTVGTGGLVIGRFMSTGGSTGGGQSSGQGVSFVGMLSDPNEELIFDFTIDVSTQVTLRTYSYAGGTNVSGQVIPRGGFDPQLFLFAADGAFIAGNDDGGSNVPADPANGVRFDTFLQRTLEAGNYTVAVTVFPNDPVGNNLSQGFENSAGSSFGSRSNQFAFDVIGARSATGPGQVSSEVTFVGFARQRNADGTFTTGNDFFTRANLQQNSTGVTFSNTSLLNNVSVVAGIPPVNPPPVNPPPVDPPPPPPPPPPLPPVEPPPQVIVADVVLGPVETVLDSPASEAAADESGDGGGPGGFGAGFTGLIDTSSFSTEALIEEPVASGSDSTLWTDGDDDGGRADEEEEEESNAGGTPAPGVNP